MSYYPAITLELNEFEPSNEREVEIIRRLIGFWNEYHDVALGSEITAGLGHITAQSRVENRTGDKVLLVYSAKEGRWKYPGAHIEVSPRQTAIEEASRALGQEVEPPDARIFSVGERVIPEYWNTPAHTHFEITYRFVAEEKDDLPRGACWFTLEAAREKLEEEETTQ